MRLQDQLVFAFDILRRSRARALLSLSGILIGSLSITFMLGVGQITSTTITQQLTQVTGRSVIVQQSNINQGQNALRLTSDDVDLIAGIEGARPLPQNFLLARYNTAENALVPVTLSGSVGDVTRIDATTQIEEGRYFNAYEASSARPVGVLNSRAARDFFKDTDPIGQTLLLTLQNSSRLQITVVGVLEPLPGLFSSISTPQVIVPNGIIWQQSRVQSTNTYDVIQVIADGTVSLDQLSAKIDRLLTEHHGSQKFLVQSADLFTNTIGTITGIITVILAGIGGLSLLVAGIGILNIMLGAVQERIRDIGLLMALGATRELVSGLFLLEALMLSSAGGLLGTALAVMALWVVTLVLPVSVSFHLTWLTVVVPPLISVVMGVAFGVVPASRAAALDPIECLRTE